VSISYVTNGSLVSSATTAAVGYPGSIQSGDLLLLCAVAKYSAFTSAPPSGFTLLTERVAGSGGTGADIGNTRTTVWYRIADGTETGSVNVTKATETGTVISAMMLLCRRTAGYQWDVVGESGSSSSGTTSWSAVGSNDIGIRSGDLVFAVSGINTDGGTWSAHAMSATGATFSVATERNDVGTTTGHDVKLVISQHPCTAGESTTFPTYTATCSTGTPDGGTVFVRLSEAIGLTADQGTHTLSGQIAGLATGYRIAAEQGSHALTWKNVNHQLGTGDLRAWAEGAWAVDTWYGTSWYGQGALSYSIPADYGIYALTGQAGLFKQSRIAAQGSYTLSGQDVIFTRGIAMTAAQGSYTLSGQSAGSSRTYSLAAAQGSYTQTSINTGLYPGSTTGQAWLPDAWYSGAWSGTVWADNTSAPGAYNLSAATGYYAIGAEGSAVSWFQNAWVDGAWHLQAWSSGQTATGLYRNVVMTAGQGSYTYTGDSPVYRDILLQTVPGGVYALAGQAASLNRGVSMTAAAGTYTLTGQSAGTYKGYLLTGVFGGYLSIGYAAEFVIGIGEYLNTGYLTLTGYDTAFSLTRKLIAEQGAYTLSGQAANLNYGDIMVANSGSYALSGQDVTFTYVKRLTAETGYYTLGGQVQGEIPPVVTIDIPANSGGWWPVRRKKKERERVKYVYDDLPTDEEVQVEMEILAELPKKAQKLVINTVKSASNVETRTQASLLANAYLQEPQQRNLMGRLRSSAEKQKIKWDDDFFSITQALILDSLKKKSNQELLDRLMAEEEAEAAEVNEIFELWMEQL
jgi:hypothetical protein